MKFLITNDDGIDAPGLAALEQVARQHGECVTVAPLEPLSGCGHQATTHASLRLTEIETARYAISGTPVDCVRIGLLHLAPNADWVLSGINNGANLGVDIYMSGTVAAAREACWMGKRAMAISQYRNAKSSRGWSETVEQAQTVLSRLLTAESPPHSYLNINLPDAEAVKPTHSRNEMVGTAAATDSDEIVFCQLDPHPLPTSFRQQGDTFTYSGVYQQRKRGPGSDVDVCFSGRVAVTRIFGEP